MRNWYEYANTFTSERLGIDWPAKPMAAEEEGPITPPPRRVYEKMRAEGWTMAQRERTIRSVIVSQAMSGFAVPLGVATEAYNDAMMQPLPRIGERDEEG